MFFTVTQRAAVNEATKTSSCHPSAISTTIYSRSCNFIFSTSYSLSNSVWQQTADLMTNSRGTTEDTESWKSKSQNLWDHPGFKFSTSKSQNFPQMFTERFLKSTFLSACTKLKLNTLKWVSGDFHLLCLAKQRSWLTWLDPVTLELSQPEKMSFIELIFRFEAKSDVRSQSMIIQPHRLHSTHNSTSRCLRCTWLMGSQKQEKSHSFHLFYCL